MPAFIDLTGKRFGKITVMRRSTCDSKKPRWDCLCDCGKTMSVLGCSLRDGRTLSCGCFHIERVTKHNKSRTALYKLWQCMRSRCSNRNHRNYHRYGGRGIKVCDRWSDFEFFAMDMSPRPSPKHTLDRIDNDGDYDPSNCRWATHREQMLNRSLLLDLSGKQFGLLTAISPVGSNKHGKVLWRCLCKCGKEKTTLSANLVQGKTKSCGCLLHYPRKEIPKMAR